MSPPCCSTWLTFASKSFQIRRRNKCASLGGKFINLELCSKTLCTFCVNSSSADLSSKRVRTSVPNMIAQSTVKETNQSIESFTDSFFLPSIDQRYSWCSSFGSSYISLLDCSDSACQRSHRFWVHFSICTSIQFKFPFNSSRLSIRLLCSHSAPSLRLGIPHRWDTICNSFSAPLT